MENGADFNLLISGVATTLFIASRDGNIKIVKLLLENGVDANMKLNDKGTTALINASQNGHQEIVKLLLEGGADINAVNTDGETAFRQACLMDHVELATYLFEKGALTEFEDSSIKGMELNGTIHNIIGDYFLSQDIMDKARDSYVKSHKYYSKLVDEYSGDVTSLAWKQFGMFMLQGLAATAQSYVSHHQSMTQNQQFAQISAMKYAGRSNTGIQGYYSYMSKYNHSYRPTYQGGNFFRPTKSGSLDEKKAYAKAKKKHYQCCESLIEKVLNCFDENKDPADLHRCVNVLTIRNN
ncbi:putative ankyrin repeat domain protein [Desulfosarcina variabilis str. Montpellier]